MSFSKEKAPTRGALCIVARVLNEATTMMQSVPGIQTLLFLITYIVPISGKHISFSAAEAPTMIALDLVGGVVNEAATMTRGAPYIQTLSCLITYIVSIDDVRTKNFGLLKSP